MTNNVGNSEAEQTESSGFSALASTVGDFALGTSIPEPIRRNAFKAFGQLCTAAVDVPVAILEGVAAEKRAESRARQILIETSASQIAAQMNLAPEFAEAAATRFGQKIVREQVNLNKITRIAANELKSENSIYSSTAPAAEEQPPSTINQDWLNLFENEASEKSTEEMQILFGKILAGEIKNPQSFSIKTLRLIGQLDSRVANLFKTLCSLSISLSIPNHVIDVRVCALGGNAASNSLQKYMLNFTQLNLLHEYGLIISDYDSYMNYGLSLYQNNRVNLALVFGGQKYCLMPKSTTNPRTEINIQGIALTNTGKELFSIVDIVPNEEYSKDLRDYLSSQGVILTNIAG